MALTTSKGPAGPSQGLSFWPGEAQRNRPQARHGGTDDPGGKWVEKAGQRRRRYYKLTTAGRTVLGEQRASWQELLVALQRVTGITRIG